MVMVKGFHPKRAGKHSHSFPPLCILGFTYLKDDISHILYRVIMSNCILWFLSDGHKKTPNWQNPTIFVKILYGHFDILISQKSQVKKIPAFQGCAKMVCFPSWHGSVCLSLLVSVNTRCSLYYMREHLGISGSVFRKKSICFGDQMSLGVHLRA